MSAAELEDGGTAAPGPAPSPAASLTELPRPSAEGELRRRVLYLMLFRLVLISLVLGTTLLLAYLSDVDLSSPSSLFLFGIIGATYLLTIVYAVALERGVSPSRLADAQLAADLVTTTVLMHVTGGAGSAYTFFYPLSIIGAAVIRFRIGAVVVLLGSVTLFTTVSLLGWADLLPVPTGQRILPSDLSTVALGRAMALNLAAFAGVGILAINLGGQIQRTAASLETQRTATADLYALHEDIVRSLSSGLITVGAGAEIITVNQTASEILGLAPATAHGRPIAQVLPGLEHKLAGLAPRASLWRDDLVIERPDGQLVLGISVSPLRNNRDQVIGRVINFQDLTELRRMEDEVKRTERLAMVGTLAAGVAHEIRNPLASISGSIELLRAQVYDDEEDRALMDIVTREIERLNALITDLLDYTNPQPRERVRFDIAAMVAETLQVFRQDRSFGEVGVEAAPDSVSSGLEVSGDPGKLRQVLWNLLRNAAEAAARGGGTVTVRVEQRGERAAVEVADDGPGIAPEHLGRVFDPFFTTKSRGSGLGLATCHSIVTEHGGMVDVDSQPGRGSRFTVRLPLATGEASRSDVYSTAS